MTPAQAAAIREIAAREFRDAAEDAAYSRFGAHARALERMRLALVAHCAARRPAVRRLDATGRVVASWSGSITREQLEAAQAAAIPIDPDDVGRADVEACPRRGWCPDECPSLRGEPACADAIERRMKR